MAFLYLDIETLPTVDEAVIAEISAGITPPKSITKAETLAAWEAETRPGLVAEAIAKTSFDGALGRICCIGWAWGGDRIQRALCQQDMSDEAENLATAFAMIDQTRTSPMVAVAGHNVADFDLRFIRQRAVALGVKVPAWWPTNPKPWDDSVFDTMHQWAVARGSITLDKLCKALGIPGKGDVTGADVWPMWQAGKRLEVADYCVADVERVRAVHRKFIAAGV
jgi:3'-5' exonuclease